MAPALVAEPISSAKPVAAEEKATVQSTLQELADQVQQNARTITTFLRSHGHPSPSFERDAPTSTLPPSAPAEIRTARLALMGAALKAFQLAAGPSEYLPNLAVGVNSRLCFHFVQIA